MPLTASRRSGHARLFDQTSLSLLENARDGDQEAINELCSRYWFPLRTWALSQGLVRQTDDADDVIQGFFAKMLEKGSLARHDVGRARFRTYLRTCLRRYAIDLLRRRTLERAEPPPDADDHWIEELASVEVDGAKADKPWAEDILLAARERLRHEWTTSGQRECYEALEPMLDGSPSAEGLEPLAARLGLSHENTRVRLHRMRKRFREIIMNLLKAELPEDGTGDEFAEEARRFREALLA
ncbi:MAG: hypothetical protein IT581_11870 [Verrucomicrobiales bacterium]|nr:hypothetical protein [Verrucomicrobiales bacterium]